MAQQNSKTKRLRISGRSFLAFVLVPEAPIKEWIQILDHEVARSQGFFAGKNFILDLRLINSNIDDLTTLFDLLMERHIQVVGVEGGEHIPQLLKKWGLPNGLLSQQGTVPLTRDLSPQKKQILREPHTHVVSSPVRSGQHVVWPDGDLVILGNVASGAEVTASGSIHIYGKLSGRAIAGIGNHGSARIYTQELNAELVAIDGFYATAEEMDKNCSDKACCIYLVKEKLHFKKIR